LTKQILVGKDLQKKNHQTTPTQLC